MREKSEVSNFTKHQVRVRIDGFKPERLISLIMEKGFEIRSLKYTDETRVFFNVSYNGYEELKKDCHNRYSVKIMDEKGIIPLIEKMKGKRNAVLGLIIFITIVAFQSFFVKEINVIGCNLISEADIRNTLREEGLFEGSFKNFDCERIENRLFMEYEPLVWARVSYEGRYVQVEISENEPGKLKKVDKSLPCNIIADEDCYIERILSYRGRSIVEKYDYVKKGATLISGIVPIENPTYEVEKDDETQLYVHAYGKVIARIPYSYAFNIEKNAGKEDAEAKLRRWISKNIPKNAEILNKSLNFSEKKNIIKVYGTIETRQLVGEEKEINIDKRKPRTEKDNT